MAVASLLAANDLRPAGRGPLRTLLALVALLAGAELSAAASGPSLRLLGESTAAVEAHGLDPELLEQLRSSGLTDLKWAELFAVYTREAAGSDLPPLLGTYSLDDAAVRFTPRVPFRAGQSYVARWHSPPGDEAEPVRMELAFSIPTPAITPSTVVAAIYPSASVLPANLLRVYIQFSAPMSEGEAQERLRLVTLEGREIEGAFVAPERELWSPDRTRLTLFFDPGRIKRGVGPNLEVGPPLEAGRAYRLTVDAAWRDARGAPLRGGHSKEFEVAASDRDQPRLRDWTLEVPERPEAPVSLHFPEPLDYALLHRLLDIRDDAGGLVPGVVRVSEEETRWNFEPEDPWESQPYTIRIDTALEDVAGNSLRRPFESVIGGGDAGRAPEVVELAFSVRPR